MESPTAATETPTQGAAEEGASGPTAAATEAAATLPVGFTPITRNGDWTPVIQERDGVEMALVPVGCFMMGSDDGQSNEQPVHQVCFEQPFWIDVTEVTNAQFEAFGGRATVDYSWIDGQMPRGWIVWYDAVDFCNLRGIRLPTEAEWEYAARGPDSWTYTWGDTFATDKVVYGTAFYQAVGSKPENASWVGALDMIASVSEWVSDYYGPYTADRQVNPTGAASGIYHLLKGGSSWESDYRLRASYRFPYDPNYQADQFGVRCARDY